MFQNNNYNSIREKLCNSSCILECNFDFNTSNNLVGLPIKSNASIVSYKNNVFGLVHANGIIIKNVSSSYIPSTFIKIKHKFLNSSLSIQTKNHDNPFFSLIHISNDLLCLITHKFIFFYKSFQLISKFVITGPIHSLYFNDYIYVLTKNGIFWFNVNNIHAITSGFISILLESPIIQALSTVHEDNLYLFLITSTFIHVFLLPSIIITQFTDSTSSLYSYTTPTFISKIQLFDNFNINPILSSEIVEIPIESVKQISSNQILFDVSLLILQFEKNIYFFSFYNQKLSLSSYHETNLKYSFTLFQNQVISKSRLSNKIIISPILYKTNEYQISYDDLRQTSSHTISNSIFIDILDTSNELFVDTTNFHPSFSLIHATIHSVNNKLYLDNKTYGTTFVNLDFNSKIISFDSYIKPFPYFNSSIFSVSNHIYFFESTYYLLNSLLGLMSISFDYNYVNHIKTIDTFLEDDSFYLIPSKMNVTTYKFSKNKFNLKKFCSSEIFFNNLFPIIVFSLPIDVQSFIYPVPLSVSEPIYTLHDYCLVYSKNHKFLPIISNTNYFGKDGINSNFTLTDQTIQYTRLFESYYLKTNIDSSGSILFSSHNLPLGMIISQQSILPPKIISNIIDKYLSSQLSISKSYKYGRNDIDNNKVLDVTTDTIIFYTILLRPFSVMDQNYLPFDIDFDSQIVELYVEDLFLGYSMILINLPVDSHNIPNHLKESNYVYMSKPYPSLDDLILNKSNNLELTIHSKNISIKKTGLLFENNRILSHKIIFYKTNLNLLGLNVINILDIDQKIIDLSSLSSYNVSLEDIQRAIDSNINGFIVTENSSQFISKNKNIIGYIIDSEIYEHYNDLYFKSTTTIKMYKLDQSEISSTWIEEQGPISIPDHSLINFSL